MADEKEDVFMEITNKDIYHMIEKQGKTLNKTLEQATKTNGRVNKLEKTSVGLWVSNHPFKFALGALVFIAVTISDLRHPIMDLLMRIFV